MSEQTNGTAPSERCIECEELELARVRDARPSQTMPLPADALDGLPAGRGSADLTRRRLLQGGVAGLAAIYGPKLLGFEQVFESAVAEAAPSSNNCLVMIYLAGGNDGLNVLLPGTGAGADYAAYAAARPTIARVQGASGSGRVGSRDLPGTGGALAWANPVLTSTAGGDNGSSSFGFDTLYGNGGGGPGSDLAVLPAVDAVPASFSHFDSSDHWFAGTTKPTTTGWLGRWIDRNGSATNPLQAVSIDTGLSKAIRTAVNPVCAIQSTSQVGFSLRPSYALPYGNASRSDANAAMAALAGVGSGGGSLARAQAAYGQAVRTAGSAATINATPATAPSYPSGTLGTKLKLAARMLSAGLGTRVITIHWGGFDTHGNQVATQDRQLVELSQCLAAFRGDLQARGVEQNVATFCFSEFGRRVAENGSNGTDHGAGGLMLLSGSGVRGGVASEFPGVESGEVVSGNLKITTDYRSVYQSILRDWLGGDLTGVLPDGEAAAIQRADGGNSLFD